MEHAVIEFFQWMKDRKLTDKPWLILGKGPSFDKHALLPRLSEEFHTVGLNHVCRQRTVFLSHMIDSQVFKEIKHLEDRTEFLILPWTPHVDFKPTTKTLEDFVKESKLLKFMDGRGRLLWYNASTGSTPRAGSPGVGVAWFSAEAVVRMLAMAGVKTIRTLGIDGGSSYSSSFKDIQPFRGGHNTFDLQNGPIQATVKEFGVSYGPLL